MKWIAAAVLIAVGCGGQKRTAQPPLSTPTPTSSTSSAPASNERQPVGATLTVSSDIYRLCHLDAPTPVDAAPKFGFDQTLITRDDAVVLDRIATCLTTGPLAGKRVQLTGRADPRGTEEYNMSLGARRAHAVATYLEGQKVRGADINETSRGALDANGGDESTWSKDRRVDIALMP